MAAATQPVMHTKMQIQMPMVPKNEWISSRRPKPNARPISTVYQRVIPSVRKPSMACKKCMSFH